MPKVYAATDIGPARPINEDSFACLPSGGYMVADGMGGHAAGDVASHIFINTVTSYLEDEKDISEAVLRKAVLLANDTILKAVGSHPDYAGMGTTATLFHQKDDVCVFAHVGDSRLYLVHSGVMVQISRDHSYVQDLLEQGKITQEEARVHPKRNMITRAVGIEEHLVVDTGMFRVAPDDVLLLCTDGLTSVISDEEIQEILLRENSSDKAAELLRSALDAGSRDNITAVVVDYHA